MTTSGLDEGFLRDGLDLVPGHVLAGRYVIAEELGAGGMGTVYRAIDNRTGDHLAVKSLSRPDPELLVRFKREYRAVADLRHPNLVKLGELFEDGGRVYFTMELVDGPDLRTWIRANLAARESRRAGEAAAPPYDPVRLHAGFRQLADALDALHGASHVHRDVKPSNVLVDDGGRVVLLDFGLAARLEDGRQRSDVLAAGTLAYMAPEQATGQAIGPPADWYSFGVLLYEVLTERLPFDGDPMALLSAKLGEDAPDPSAVAAGIPRDLADLCTALLAREPGRRPSPAQVLRVFSRGGSISAPPSFAPAVRAFVGRRRELDELAVAALAAQRAPVIQLVIGESGLGKTALVSHHLRSLAEHDHTLVLDSRCHERDALPFKAFDGIADVLARRLHKLPDDEVDGLLPRRPELLGALFPALDHVRPIGRHAGAGAELLRKLGQGDARRIAFGAFRELLVRIAVRRRLVLFIDDLHRADPDSLDLLAQVMRAEDGPAALLIGTARPSAVVDDLIAMGSRGEIVVPRVLRLGPLEPGEARELARRVQAAGADEPTAPGGEMPLSDVVVQSGGHPGYILELARTTVAHRDEPRSLDEMILARVARLPAEQGHVLAMLAIAEAPLQAGVLAAAARRSAGDLAAILDVLRDAELIVTTGRRGTDWVEPYHDRVADAVRGRLTDASRRSAHAALARALDDNASEPERVLSHYLAAEQHGPVLRLAALAAQRASAAMEHRRAVRLYRLALDQDPSEPDAERLHLAVAGALAAIGDGRGAAEHFRAVARHADGRGDHDGELRARQSAADSLFFTGEITRGAELLDEILRELGLGMARSRAGALTRLGWARLRLRFAPKAAKPARAAVGPRERAVLDACWSAATGLSTIDPIRSLEYQSHFLRLARVAGEPTLVARGLVLESLYAATGGVARRDDVAALLAEAAALATSETDRGWVQLGRATTAMLLGDFEASIAAADAALAAFNELSRAGVWERRTARLFAVWSRWFAGRLDECARALAEGIAEARELGDMYSVTQLRSGIGASTLLVGGDVESFWRLTREAEDRWRSPSFQTPNYYQMVHHVNGALYAGEPAAARARVLRDWPALERSMLLRVEFIAIDAWHVHSRALAGAAAATPVDARARVLAELDRVAAQLGRFAVPRAEAAAAMARAAAALLGGARDDQAALAHLRHAIASFEHAGMAAFGQVARWSAAVLRDGAGPSPERDAAEAVLRAQGVVDVARFAAMLSPGLVTTAGASR